MTHLSSSIQIQASPLLNISIVFSNLLATNLANIDNEAAKAMARKMKYWQASPTLAISLHLTVLALILLYIGNIIQKVCCICYRNFQTAACLAFHFRPVVMLFGFLAFDSGVFLLAHLCSILLDQVQEERTTKGKKSGCITVLFHVLLHSIVLSCWLNFSISTYIFLFQIYYLNSTSNWMMKLQRQLQLCPKLLPES